MAKPITSATPIPLVRCISCARLRKHWRKGRCLECSNRERKAKGLKPEEG